MQRNSNARPALDARVIALPSPPANLAEPRRQNEGLQGHDGSRRHSSNRLSLHLPGRFRAAPADVQTAQQPRPSAARHRAVLDAAGANWLHDIFGNSIAVAEYRETGRGGSPRIVFSGEALSVGGSPNFDRTLRRALSFQLTPQTRRLISGGRRSAIIPTQGPKSISGRGNSSMPPPTETPSTCQGDDGSHPLSVLLRPPRRIRDASAGADPLATRSGTCRDYALLMMEAARCLGTASRFVSGYLYDETLIGGGNSDLVAAANRMCGSRSIFRAPDGSSSIRRTDSWAERTSYV
jgi:hypothetical protein